jgi:hypothetical protein
MPTRRAEPHRLVWIDIKTNFPDHDDDDDDDEDDHRRGRHR